MAQPQVFALSLFEFIFWIIILTKQNISRVLSQTYERWNALRICPNFRQSRKFRFTIARRRIRLGKSGPKSADDDGEIGENKAKVSARLARMSEARLAVARLAKACHHASGFNGRAVEPFVWALLDLSDAEIPAGLYRINQMFAELPGFRPLGLGGDLPGYHIYGFQRPGAGL